MDISLVLVVHPVESRVHGEPGEHAVLLLVAVGRGEVDGAALVVEAAVGVLEVLVPGLDDAQVHARPLVHHRDRQRVHLLLAPLRKSNQTGLECMHTL